MHIRQAKRQTSVSIRCSHVFISISEATFVVVFGTTVDSIYLLLPKWEFAWKSYRLVVHIESAVFVSCHLACTHDRTPHETMDLCNKYDKIRWSCFVHRNTHSTVWRWALVAVSFGQQWKSYLCVFFFLSFAYQPRTLIASIFRYHLSLFLIFRQFL